jgi:tetratricopeptide (TPR) repeat protein
MTTLPIEDIVKQAHASYKSEEFIEAAKRFDAAAKAYTATGDLLTAAEMQNNQSVALLKSGKAPEALDAVRGTDAVFEAAGDSKRQAMAYGNIAAALDELHHPIEAMQYYTQSADILKQIGEHDLRAYVLERISALQLRTGKRIESLVTMEAAIDSKAKPSFKDRLLKGLMGIIHRLSGQK